VSGWGHDLISVNPGILMSCGEECVKMGALA